MKVTLRKLETDAGGCYVISILH